MVKLRKRRSGGGAPLAHLALPAGLLAAALLLPATGASAQALAVQANGSRTPAANDQPVTFTADQVQYDRDKGIVTATGHVDAWQNGRELHADTVTFDRTTNVAAARGHVVLEEPGGQVLFGDYVELTQGMRDAVLKGMRALLAQNGRLAANGARRIGGKVNEMSRMVYSTCNVCAKNPDLPPMWQLRAFSAVDDTDHKRIEYEDAWLDIYGVPALYFPYFWTADPSQRRVSGFLAPSIGNESKHIGAFFTTPYYWAIDDQSDATITPLLSDRGDGQLSTQYRRRFNDGTLSINAALAYEQPYTYDGIPDATGLQGYIYAVGQFNYNDNWRYGFNIQRATSAEYLNDYRITGAGNDFLTSQLYVEGFGEGSWAKVDTLLYQAIDSVVPPGTLPFVLPRYQYSYFGQPDALGGRFSLDFSSWNVIRQIGTSDQRAGLSMNWERPFTGLDGDLWKVTLHLDSAVYNYQNLNQQPNYSTIANNGSAAHAQPDLAVEVHWPWEHATKDWGIQTIEPIVQVVASPNTYNNVPTNIPNEDSLDLEFTDANLFSLNRFGGVDRFEGGLRANAGLHTNWLLNNGASVDGLIGQVYRATDTNSFPVGSGLNRTISDIVARETISPVDWLNLTARGRFDPGNLTVHYGDVVGAVGKPVFTVSGGFIYTPINPFTLYDFAPGTVIGRVPRKEITLGFGSKISHYSASAFVRQDVQSNQLVAAGAQFAYENECVILAAQFYRQNTQINYNGGETIITFNITLKTIGQFGFNAS